MSRVKTFENAQQLLIIPAITLPAQTDDDKRIVLSADVCRHRAKFSDMDMLIATVAQQSPYLQGVLTT
ncbi:hypothetical protein [Microcoleus sp. FACHB-68]|uniref:hypothetical protein n=1 Tax=Microcoleus sp. FACHB-68 TaxID=2692826 RepID=UPI0016893ED3|nr:hypothetical protein [Microcoleus sp. FACHB-68]MBD1939693.1 hypothetical protein [Microcoleus sp. FACHB-68]